MADYEGREVELKLRVPDMGWIRITADQWTDIVENYNGSFQDGGHLGVVDWLKVNPDVLVSLDDPTYLSN